MGIPFFPRPRHAENRLAAASFPAPAPRLPVTAAVPRQAVPGPGAGPPGRVLAANPVYTRITGGGSLDPAEPCGCSSGRRCAAHEAARALTAAWKREDITVTEAAGEVLRRVSRDIAAGAVPGDIRSLRQLNGHEGAGRYLRRVIGADPTESGARFAGAVAGAAAGIFAVSRVLLDAGVPAGDEVWRAFRLAGSDPDLLGVARRWAEIEKLSGGPLDPAGWRPLRAAAEDAARRENLRRQARFRAPSASPGTGRRAAADSDGFQFGL